MRERDVERYLKKQIESLGGLCLKFESPGYSGVPDRLCLLPRGKLFFVEVKRPGETLRKLQEKRRKDFQALGHQVYVVDSKESINQLIQATGE